MERLNHTQNCKKLIIEEILETNNNIAFFPIVDNKNMANIILSLKGEDFYKILALLNHSNYNGYFSQKKKLELVKVINKNKKIENFLREWIKLEPPNRDVMKIEIYALNLLLERMIIKGISEDILDSLEEIKFNIFNSTENLKNKFHNFKSQIICKNNEVKDVYEILMGVVNGNHNLDIKDLIYIKNSYPDELELLTLP
jgi:hypothetical protein